MTGVQAEAVRGVLRRHRFKVREADADGARYLYGDRHQYTKLATLLTHTGLILFIVAAAVTTKFGDEQPLLLVEGGSLTVQPVGSPGILVVKNIAFEAPGFAETGVARTSRPSSRSTRTARRSPTRRSGSTTPSRSRATRSTRTTSARRPTSSSATRTASRSGTGRSRSTTRRAGCRTAR